VIDQNGLMSRAREILISPVHGVDNLAEIAEQISRSGLKVRLNLQMHKYIWGPETRGV